MPLSLSLGLYGLLVATIIDVGEFEEDQTEHRGAVFGGAEVGVGAQVVGGGPEVVFELFELLAVH